jgi:hypothetical protein
LTLLAGSQAFGRLEHLLIHLREDRLRA